MRLNSWVIGGVAAAVIVAGAATVIGVASAQEGGDGADTPRQERRGRFLERVAENLGVDTAQLETAIDDAQLDIIDEALANGRINEEQAAKLRQRVEDGKGIFGPLLKHRHVRRVQVRHAIVESAATALNISTGELRAELKAGKSIADVAAEQGVALDDVKQQILDDASAKLATAVSNGRITQERADEMLGNLSARLDDLLNKSRTPG
jgi:hypothetical protein